MDFIMEKTSNIIVLNYKNNEIVNILLNDEYIKEIKDNGLKEFLKSREKEFDIDADNCSFMVSDKFNKRTVLRKKQTFNICVDYNVSGYVTDTVTVEADNEDEAIKIVKDSIINGTLIDGSYDENVITDVESNFQYDCFEIIDKNNNVSIYPRGEYDKMEYLTYKKDESRES